LANHILKFDGVIPPLLTPLQEDGKVDLNGLEAIIEFQIKSGATGVFILGSSGEAIYHRDETRAEIIAHTAKIVKNRVNILVGALDSTPLRVIEQIRKLSNPNIDGWVVTAPYYANLSDEEVENHFRLISKSTSEPILAYNIPGNTHRLLSSSLLADLLNEGTITGLKDSSNNLPEFEEVVNKTKIRDVVSLLTGADSLAQGALNLGADGFVPGLSNVRPDLFVSILNAHKSGDDKKVEQIQERINRLTKIYGIGQQFGIGRHASELGAMKIALVRSGILKTARVANPLSEYPKEAIKTLYEVLDSVDK